MNPNKPDEGLRTSPEKQPTFPSATMEKQERNKTKASQAAAPSSTKGLKDASNAKVQNSPKASTSTTILSGIVPLAPSTNPSIEQQATLSSDSSEYEEDLPPPNFPYRATGASITGGIGPSAGIPVSKQTGPLTTSFEQKGLSEFPAVLKGNQRKDGPKNVTSAKGVTSIILPRINPEPLATVPGAIREFKFTIDTPVPQQSIHPSAAEPFVFTREAKQPLEKAKFSPAKRRLFQPSKKEDNDEEHKLPQLVFSLPGSFAPLPQNEETVEESKFLPVKSSLAEAFAVAPQAKKPAEEPMFVPVKASLLRPSASTSPPKKLVEEPKSYPVKSSLAEAFKKPAEEEMLLPVKTPTAKPPAPSFRSMRPVEEPQLIPFQSPLTKSPLTTRQARQSIELPQSPAVKHSTEMEFERSTGRIVEHQEGKADDEKKAQAVRELLAEKSQLRLEREALAREQAALEFKLHGQTDNTKNVEGREQEVRKAMSAKDKEIADLKAANNRLKKAMETVILPAPKPEQGKGSSIEKENLLAGKQKEIDDLKDEVKKWEEKEAELSGSTGKEIEELKLKLQLSGEVEARALRRYEKTKDIYNDLFSLQARNEQQAKKLENLAAKLAKEAEAKQKATSRANRLQTQIYEQSDTIRDVGLEKVELRNMVHKQEAELAKYIGLERRLEAEADLGLVKVVLESERAKMGEVDTRRENKVKATLQSLEEGERERRQRLVDELEVKDAELYEAQKEVRELGRKLLASNQATAAASASQISQSSPSSPSKPSPSSTTHSSPSTSSTPPAAGAMPWFQLQRSPIGIQMNLSPRRLLIFLLTFLFAFFLVPLSQYNNSLSQQAIEEGDMWQTANEVSRHEVVEPRAQRIIWEAQTLQIWDRHDKPLTEEEGWTRTREPARSYDEGF